MRRISTIALLAALTAPLPVAAQGLSQTPQNTPDSRDLPAVVALEARDCRRLLAQRGMVTQHQPAPDVNYQPGRDVDSQGRPIAPADLPSGSQPFFDGPITLDLQIPLRRLTGDRTPPRLGRSETNVGTVTVDPLTGKLAFNGRPLEPAGEDALAVACRDYLSRPQPRR